MKSLARIAEFAALVTVALVGWSSPGIAHNVENVGGDGGTPFSYTCRSGGYLNGFAASSGKATDWLNGLCYPNDGNSDGAWYLGSIGTYGGGEGASIACPGNWFIIGMRVFVDNNAIVHHLSITCRSRDGANKQEKEMPVHGGVIAYHHYIACPEGEVATGVYGRSGSLVDQIGLKCNPR